MGSSIDISLYNTRSCVRELARPSRSLALPPFLLLLLLLLAVTMLARRLLSRSSVPAQRTLFTTYPRSAVYVLPIDPKSPSTAATNVDAAALWNSTPAAKSSKVPKVGTTRIFYDTPRGADSTDVTALTSLGDRWATSTGDGRREAVRTAVGSAVNALGEDVDGETVLIDASADPHAAGASLVRRCLCGASCPSSCRVASGDVQFHAQDRTPFALRPSQGRAHPGEARLAFTSGA